ncbi:tetratricopeptide repeat-containing sulfotransferase family protein [Pseudoalteromonas sp. T1lg75]|uniref:tetratricopeptide repeat-containing sulfotransferase family protein n=1 Tax=Pseudoalteromonas sp. T1lg75 TaxID=2077102 RepID=UPI000CF64DB4|nr:sulfotransferase [Pseudoalteromonas sp. T1lg75]
MNVLAHANRLLGENKLKQAEFHFKSLLEANPNQGEAWFGLGRIAMRLEKYPQAVYLLQKACQRLPKVLEPLFALADAFDALKKQQDAFAILDYCCKIAPHNGEAFYRLAQHQLVYGFMEQARHTLTLGLACPDQDVTLYLYYELAHLDPSAIGSEQIARLHTLLRGTQNKHANVVAHYTLGKSYHQVGDKNQAFAHYRLANKLQAKLCPAFSKKGFDSYLDEIKTLFSADFIRSQRDGIKASFTPVFIVGMPRSGSTLLEQMLCQHPKVASLGENPVFSGKLMAYLSAVTERPFPACMTDLNAEMRSKLRQMYADEVAKQQLGHQFILNKLPANFQAIGAIKALFPNALFIDMRRSFYPMAWSVFGHYFGANEAFFCDMDMLQDYYQGYEGLMQHWRQSVGDSLYTQHYEQLIEQPEQVLRQLCAWLDIVYTEQCLNYHSSNSAVTTLSRIQVRKKLYQGANLAYKEYEQAFLGCFSHVVQTRPQHPETDPALPAGE